MDIGCYLIYTSRLIFGEEPRRVLGIIERDPEMQTDNMTSGILDFPSGQAIFTCSTQVAPYQRVQIIGTQGRIEVEIPFNAPPTSPAVSSRTKGAISRVEVRRFWNLRRATNTPFKETCFQKPSAKERSWPFLWRARSGTWR